MSFGRFHLEGRFLRNDAPCGATPTDQRGVRRDSLAAGVIA